VSIVETSRTSQRWRENVSVTDILSNEQIHPWQFSIWKRNITWRCFRLNITLQNI